VFDDDIDEVDGDRVDGAAASLALADDTCMCAGRQRVCGEVCAHSRMAAA
jgi:hypothetical protein